MKAGHPCIVVRLLPYLLAVVGQLRRCQPPEASPVC